jgi:tripartite-type tricarboxylate transporter receptor subunit TctC
MFMLRTLAFLSAALFLSTAFAQSDYPVRPVRLITPFTAGGAIDVLTRVIAERLQAKLGQSVVVDPIPGANTIIGTQALVKSAPDGYTFMITTMSTTVNNPVMYAKLPYDAAKDLAPITQLSYGSVLLVGPASAPYGDMKGFIAWAKAQNRPISYGSWGIGSSGHLYGQVLQRDHGVAMNHVPYKGDVLAIADVQNGSLDVTFASPTSAKPRIAANAIKPLGMTGPRRSVAMPELATFGEQGVKGFELDIWVGAYAPGGTPKAIRERLQRELRAVINEPDIRKRMHDQGQVPIGNTPDEFAANFQADAPKWAELIRASGAKVE